jgi:hypothetical protein
MTTTWNLGEACDDYLRSPCKIYLIDERVTLFQALERAALFLIRDNESHILPRVVSNPILINSDAVISVFALCAGPRLTA